MGVFKVLLKKHVQVLHLGFVPGQVVFRRVIVQCWHIHGGQYAQDILIEAFSPKLLRAAILFVVIRAVAFKALGKSQRLLV